MNTDTRTDFDTVVIGAGPSGLAVARELGHRHDVSALVIDRAAAPANAWRTRYENFRLNTTGLLSHLPGQRIALTAGRWPSRKDMVDYYDDYVARQRITLQLKCDVNRIDRARDGWQLNTSSGDIKAPTVVLATGNYRTPVMPTWPGLSRFSGDVIHSADYVNAGPYQGCDVLVVGAGNSGADIAVQLADHGAGRVWLAVRTPPHLVRRAMGPIPSDLLMELSARIPARVVDSFMTHTHRFMWGGDLSVLGFRRPPLGLKSTVQQTGRIPTLADELVDAVRHGRIRVVAAVESLEPDRVRLVDGSTVAPQVIIAATGFRADLDGLVGHLGVLDDDGSPRGGFACHLGDGLFAIGYGIPPSGPLRAIRRHATQLARTIARHLATRAPVTVSAQRASGRGPGR